MLLVVGQIGKPHGIRGEVSVVVRTDEPEARFTAGSVFTTEVPRDRRVSAGPAGAPAPGVRFEVPKQLTLSSIRWHQGRGIAVFEGIDDRNVAEAMRGVFLQVDSEALEPPDDPDEFHDHQLVGLRVVSASSGEEYGTVQRIEHAPSSDLIVLAKTGGGTALIPFVTAIVPTVDLPGRRVLVDLPEGLLDL
ncbi:ribosome maturation factor RimM [Actinoplanes sp. NBRC 101535]|nr:ribosome maturation factor RimM [Actinoplanes sp. NBRC 101535]